MSNKENDLNHWIENFLKQRKFSKYELEVAGKTSKGDGYLGQVTFVKVLTGIGKEKGKIYHLVIKSPKKSEELRKKLPIKEFFEREMFMYTKVFPAFRTFQLENGIKEPFMKFAKCYSVFNEYQREAILLQNLKCLEYDIYDRKSSQNLNHAVLMFQNYAKFHALSLAMKKQNPEQFTNLTENMNDLMSMFLRQMQMIPSMTCMFQEALNLLKDEDNITYKKFLHYNEDIITKMLTKVKNPSDGIFTILHGDCWNNNMMFTYSDKSKKIPNDMMFLDFQLSSVGSPVYDLSYYLYAVGDENLYKYHDLLLQTYHYSLMSYLNELNVTSYDITLEDIKNHWAQYGSYGMVMAPFILKVELSETEEVVDLGETAETGDLSEAFNMKLQKKDAYEDRVKAVLKHYASFI